MTMRVLIADRNARLLESICRTFGPQFSIQPATTHEHCNELLDCDPFDLAVISEKLADGRGLHLLGQIARNAPGTLRVFAARQSRLRLLEDKLGPFGLFRTLAYPIDPQELLSALTLARISHTCADAMFATNVPMTIASRPRVRRSNSSTAPRLVSPGRAGASGRHATASLARNIASASPGDAPQPQQAAASHPQRMAAQFAPTRDAAPPPAPAHQPAPSPPAATHSAVPPRLSPQFEPFQLIGERRKVANRVVSGAPQRQPMRTKLVLGAAVVGVFLVTTLTLNLFDASVHVTRAFTPRPEIAQADIPAPPSNPTPAVLTTPFSPTPSVAKPAEPKPVAASPDVESADPQIAASNTPSIADPSTFSSEAYEPIYSN